MHLLPQEKIQLLDQGFLPLMEHFFTIQGEGLNAGRPAYFLRIAGCDVGCVWCDVKESWDASQHPMVHVDQMLDYVKHTDARNVVVTGGEPLMFNLDALTIALRQAGFNTWLETSGAYPITGTWDHVCLSPKKFKNPVNELYEYAQELKIIVYHKSDLDWALDHAKKVTEYCRLYIQPEWSKEKEMIPLITEFVKKHPDWTISLQTHKYMNIP